MIAVAKLPKAIPTSMHHQHHNYQKNKIAGKDSLSKESPRGVNHISGKKLINTSSMRFVKNRK